MKKNIESLISEMILYTSDTGKSLNLLKNADKKMGRREKIFHLIRDLLNFTDPFMIKILKLNPEKLDLKSNEDIDYHVYISNIKELFNNCPPLNSIYNLKRDTITFNNLLSSTEIEEIKNYVGDNRERKVINFYTPKHPRG